MTFPPYATKYEWMKHAGERAEVILLWISLTCANVIIIAETGNKKFYGKQDQRIIALGRNLHVGRPFMIKHMHVINE